MKQKKSLDVWIREAFIGKDWFPRKPEDLPNGMNYEVEYDGCKKLFHSEEEIVDFLIEIQKRVDGSLIIKSDERKPYHTNGILEDKRCKLLDMCRERSKSYNFFLR